MPSSSAALAARAAAATSAAAADTEEAEDDEDEEAEADEDLADAEAEPDDAVASKDDDEGCDGGGIAGTLIRKRARSLHREYASTLNSDENEEDDEMDASVNTRCTKAAWSSKPTNSLSSTRSVSSSNSPFPFASPVDAGAAPSAISMHCSNAAPPSTFNATARAGASTSAARQCA